MKKVLKVMLLLVLGIFLLVALGIGGFIYKARYGFNFYDTTPPTLPRDLTREAVLIFSKTNGYRHGDAIEASLPAFRQMAQENGWSLYETDNGAVFNPDQLAQFKVVVGNNTSGKVLNESQREAFKTYLENGGGYVGIHASGDNSHQWDWYEEKVIGARFSHHPLDPQIQQATLHLDKNATATLAKELPDAWPREEEWYMFFNSPRKSGSQVLFSLDETGINPSGNFGFLATDKDWGMGADHPAAWYHPVGQGRVFYSSLGHQAASFQEPAHLQMLENAIRWTGRLPE